jgi:hypothetical protein
MLKTVLAGGNTPPAGIPMPTSALAKTEPPQTVEDTKPNAPVDLAELTKTKPAVPDEPVKEARPAPPADILTTRIDTQVTPTDAEIKTQIAHKTEPPVPMSPVPAKPGEPVTPTPTPMTPVKLASDDGTPTPGKTSEATKPKRPAELDQASTTEAAPPISAATSPTDDKRNTDTLSIWEVFGVNRPPVDANATKEASPKEPTQPHVAEPTLSAKKPLTLDDWLALEEPPLPNSASGTVQTIVRLSQKPTNSMGLRKRQRQDLVHVRRPHKR